MLLNICVKDKFYTPCLFSQHRKKDSAPCKLFASSVSELIISQINFDFLTNLWSASVEACLFLLTPSALLLMSVLFTTFNFYRFLMRSFLLKEI